MLLGAMGTIMGFALTISGFFEFMAGAAELSMIKDAIYSVTIGLAVAFDIQLLGVVAALICLALYAYVLEMKTAANE